MLQAFRRYRDISSIKYIKLVDGGLTDNFGVAGISLTRLAQDNAYAPLSRERAIGLKRLMFMVVNSGRGPAQAEWAQKPESTGIMSMLPAVTDTAISSTARVTYDFFRIVMNRWNKDLINWRCSLPRAEVQAALGNGSEGWKCDDVHFYVTQVSFEDAGPANQKKLDNIPTRFALPAGDIDLLVDSADVALKHNPTFNSFLQDLRQHQPFPSMAAAN
jgi:hypothetical protein